jgi:hypothetical protein
MTAALSVVLADPACYEFEPTVFDDSGSAIVEQLLVDDQVVSLARSLLAEPLPASGGEGRS